MVEHVGLHIIEQPRLQDATLLFAFSGWMDGGDVSTGTIERITQRLHAPQFASIDPEDYCLKPGTLPSPKERGSYEAVYW